MYVWPWINGSLRLFLTHINICCWLSYSTKGVSCSSFTDSILVDISRILLFETLYLDSEAQGVSNLLTTDITALRRSSWLMVTRRRKCNWRVFARTGLWDFYHYNPLKGLICVRWGGIQWWNPLKGMRRVPELDNRGEYDYLDSRLIPGSGGTSMMITP